MCVPLLQYYVLVLFLLPNLNLAQEKNATAYFFPLSSPINKIEKCQPMTIPVA